MLGEPIWEDDRYNKPTKALLILGLVSSLCFVGAYLFGGFLSIVLLLVGVLGLIFALVYGMTNKSYSLLQVFQSGIRIKGKFLTWAEVLKVEMPEVHDPNDTSTPSILTSPGVESAEVQIVIFDTHNDKYKYLLKNKYSFVESMQQLQKSDLIVMLEGES